MKIQKNSIFQNFNDNIKNFHEFDLAFIILNNYNTNNYFENFYNEFYKLSNSFKLKILNFGILQFSNFENIKNKYFEIASNCEKNNIPLFTLTTNPLSNIETFKTFTKKSKQFNSIFIESMSIENSFLEKILDFCQLNNDLHNKSHILGFQNYLVNKNKLENFKKNNFNLFRLSEVRENISDYEPYIRESVFFNMNLSSIKYSDFPASSDAQPNGFTALEICQLSYFAGLSNKIKFLNFYGISPHNDVKNVSLKLFAQILWHFISAVEKIKLSAKTKEKTTTYHLFPDNPKKIKLKFIYNHNSELWNVEIENNKKFIKSACSYSDYYKTKNGILSDRILSLLDMKPNK